ncbi:MAG TPA: FTR1 family protein [Chthoniobacterales bacterium]
MPPVKGNPALPALASRTLWGRSLLLIGALLVVALLVWQAFTDGGAPDPMAPNTSPVSALLNIGVLVFREGLECILVLTALTASMVGDKARHKRPVTLGAVLGFVATLGTWFIATRILSDLGQSVSALDLQASTGLLAVLVLMVVMNWFFHKVYWGGWIGLHNRRKKAVIKNSAVTPFAKLSLWWGLGLLGFSSLYREGFEVVLFLQSYHLRLGDEPVLGGALLGLLLTGIVAVLSFVAHRRLPYRKMLILTGVMLGFVLVVMVGEQAQEMQQAHWLPTTQIRLLADLLPSWTGVWFSLFPTVETLVAQVLAVVVVVGSYFAARHQASLPASRSANVAA